ncbi:MAG TPA: AAA family ATPase [Gaiellaceae bacterium]|nr:AAA family ATPase [Gaiellaceae bacterium]
METERVHPAPEAVHSLPGTQRGRAENGPSLRIRLFGELDLRLGESPLPTLGSARAESLLAYLLLHRDAPQPRARIAFLLWPDSTESQARTNLRHVLHTLRRALPDADRFLDVRQRTLQWRPGVPMWLDVDVFEQAVADRRLEDALAVYAGDPLESSYDDWLLEERERLRQQYVDALESVVRELEGERRWADAIRYAERLLRADSLREESYRLLMRLCDASGDRARALRVYHECEATLRRELGIGPADVTREVYEALMPAASELQPEEDGADALAIPPLVGRTAERAQLTELWRTAEAGSSQLALVTGEPGIGKSRLVDELRAWCAHQGAVTAEARAYPVEGTLAYGGLVAWLRSEHVAARLPRRDRAHLTELTRLLPELLVDVPGLRPPEPLPESEQRQRLFDAATRTILSAGAPLLLVADDLQWFDTQTLRFVHYLLRAEPGARLLVAATARREEIDAGHAADELVAAIQALDRFSEIPLDRLSRDETEALAERMTRRSLSDDEADELYDESEGNPLFVVEALRAGPVPAGAPRAGAGASRGHAVIASRLAQLSEPAAELVGVAATVGREFTTQVLAQASELDDRSFVRGLDELWRRGLVRAHGPGAYDFSHGKIREAAYRALSPVHTQRHHLRVARALERSHAEDLNALSGRIAAHYDRAGAAEEAVAWYGKAAEAAQRLHANRDAVRLLERALELVRELPAAPERQALELRLLTALPAPLVVEGYFSERVVEVHHRALELVEELEVEAEPPLVRSLALASLARGDFEAARGFGDEIRARARRDDDGVLWVESAYVLGIAAYWQGRLEQARSQFEEAVARCRPEHRSVHLLHYAQDPEIVCLTRLAHVLWLLGRASEAGRARENGLALADARGHEYSRAVATVWAAVLALDQRDEAGLRGHAQALGSAHAAYDVPQIRIVAQALAGLVELLDGRKEGAERVRRVVADARHEEPVTPGFHALLMRLLLEACAAAGDMEAGVATADEALGMGRGAQLWEAEMRRLRAGFLAALGAERDAVETELARALDVATRQGAHPFELRIRADLDGLGARAS